MRAAVVVQSLGLALVAATSTAAGDPGGSPRFTAAIGGSAFADGTLHGLPASIGVGTLIPGRNLWWHVTAAYGPTTLDTPDGTAGDGHGGELRTGPRVVKCGLRGYLCGGASAELGLGFASRHGNRHNDLVVDTRVHFLIGFDRAAQWGLDLDVGVRGRVPLTGATEDSIGATPGVVAGVALFARY